MTVVSPQRCKVFAFYLPQFHPIAENDAWWGAGFTEWTNVRRARPVFDGHSQPAVPTDLGYYDLRDPQVLLEQSRLASEAGLAGFVFYHYWFAGRRLLERPVNDFLSSAIDFPFALSWANENWSRRWDGKKRDILIAQNYATTSPADLWRDLEPYVSDDRYIHVGDARLLLVHRPTHIPRIREWVRGLRHAAAASGRTLYLCAVGSQPLPSPSSLGFDAGVKFPPLGLIDLKCRPDALPPGLSPAFRGNLLEYRRAASCTVATSPRGRWHESVMPGWDNTARRAHRATIFLGSTPERYGSWLAEAIEREHAWADESTSMVFVNAWNEWAEGAYLEPDATHGTKYLDMTRSVILGNTPATPTPVHSNYVADFRARPGQAGSLAGRLVLGTSKHVAQRATARLEEWWLTRRA